MLTKQVPSSGLLGGTLRLGKVRSFSVSVMTQYMHSPSEENIEAVYKILKHLKRTPRKGLLFKRSEQLIVKAFTNAD